MSGSELEAILPEEEEKDLLDEGLTVGSTLEFTVDPKSREVHFLINGEDKGVAAVLPETVTGDGYRAYVGLTEKTEIEYLVGD